MGWPHGKNMRDLLLFSFTLQSGCGGAKKFYSFHLYGCCLFKKTRDLLCFLIWAFLSCHFVFLCSHSTSLCYGKTRELHGQCKQKLVFCMEIYKEFKFLHLDQCQLVSYVNNFCDTNVLMCQEWVSLFWVMNQSKRSNTKRKKLSRLSPLKLIKINHTILSYLMDYLMLNVTGTCRAILVCALLN